MRRYSKGLVAFLLTLACAGFLAAAAPPGPAGSRITCSSEAGGLKHCPADTSAGVALVATTGTAPCLLGKSWGYDNVSVWVSDGCSGEFVLGQAVEGGTPAPPAGTAQPAGPKRPTPRIETWGEFEPGDGFLVGRNNAGELSISAYALVRYVNQLPANKTFTDHLGNEHAVDTRQDVFPTGS